MAKFEKVRISLAREPITPVEEATGYEPLVPTRTDFLRAVFSHPVRFLGHGKSAFNFHPLEAPDGYAAGFFSRSSPVELNHEDLTPYMAENYEPALFMISLDKDQVAWMETNPRIGSPKRILESFFSHLLKNTNLNQWAAFVRYFESESDYWDVVAKHRHEIAKIVFRYVPPNAFEGKRKAQEYKAAVLEESNCDVLEETFKSAPGKMNPESETMRANSEIAEQGAGERELRGPKNKLLYSSGQGRVTDSVDDDDMPTVQSPAFVKRVIDRLFRK